MNVYVVGSFMNDNFGDYLLYHETVKCIKERFGNKVRVIASEVSTFYDQFEMIDRLPHKEAMKIADCVIMTGGGYFGEGDRKKLLWNLFFVKHYGMKMLDIANSGIPYIIVGVDAGPFSYFFSRLITKNIFEKDMTVSVRNEESKQFLQSIGVKR